MPSGPTGDRVICRDSIGRALLEAAGRAVRGLGCHDVDHVPVLGRHGDRPPPLRRRAQTADAWADAVSADEACRIDPDAIADWIVSRYPAPTYPAVVLGSPHAGAVHLAAALGAPWLPTSFTVTVRWPRGAVGDWTGALDAGAAVADRLLAADPQVTVRQVHDPLQRGGLCASTLTLHVRWRRLPAAYRAFLRHRLQPGAASLLLREVRTWPVLQIRPGHTFQAGSPVSGWEPRDYTMDNASLARLVAEAGGPDWTGTSAGFRRGYAEPAGEPDLEPDLRRTAAETRRPSHRVLYPDPETLSACVADLYRDGLRRRGRPADGCVVETERQLDPWQVLTTGLVPYWCESASRRAVTAAEWWLAGSSRFDAVDVLPASPGSTCDAFADRRQWRAVASFAGRRGHVGDHAMRRYPLLPLPTSHAAAQLQARPGDRSGPLRLDMVQVLAGLRHTGPGSGILVL